MISQLSIFSLSNHYSLYYLCISVSLSISAVPLRIIAPPTFTVKDVGSTSFDLNPRALGFSSIKQFSGKNGKNPWVYPLVN